MSHDFVEAALLARAGWEVWMAPDLGGSFEEPPPSIIDFLLRDRRWCQGNLQHLRVLFAQGLKLPSRLHLLMGIMSYVASPLWLLLLLVSAIEMVYGAPGRTLLDLGISQAAELGILVAATLILLFLPKLLGLAVVLEDAAATRAHGGTAAVLVSAVLESLFSALFAPVVMLQHSWYVASIVLGISTGWGAQTRSDRALPLSLVARSFAPHTLVGLAAAVLLWRSPGFGWFVPVLAGLWLAIPLVLFTSSPLLGRLSRQDGLFLNPSETRGFKVLNRAHALADSHAVSSGDAPRLVLEDGAVRALHLSLLAGQPAPAEEARLAVLRDQAARRETAGFSREDWTLLLSDSEGLKALGSFP